MNCRRQPNGSGAPTRGLPGDQRRCLRRSPWLPWALAHGLSKRSRLKAAGADGTGRGRRLCQPGRARRRANGFAANVAAGGAPARRQPPRRVSVAWPWRCPEYGPARLILARGLTCLLPGVPNAAVWSRACCRLSPHSPAAFRRLRLLKPWALALGKHGKHSNPAPRLMTWRRIAGACATVVADRAVVQRAAVQGGSPPVPTRWPGL
jgi:hypothetical protein